MNNQEVAKRFCDWLKAHSIILRFDGETGLFWRYNDGYWLVWNHDLMSRELVDFAKPLTSLTRQKITDIIYLSRYFIERINGLSDEWMAFNDVSLNLKTFDIAVPSPERTATIKVKCAYSKLAEFEMPLFKNYLSFVCQGNDKRMPDQLQELMGYALTPEVTEKCFILYGDGGTGKSVFLSLLSKLVSPARCSFSSIERLTTKEFSMDVLLGKRLNIVHEEQSLNSNVAFLKELVSGNPMDIRRLYSDTQTLIPRVKFYFGSNRFPRLDGFDRALARRIMVIPFTNWVDDKDRILDLADRIAESEMPAVYAWAIEGLKRLKANNWRFTETEESLEALADLEEASSSLSEYLKDKWVIDPEGSVEASEIYDKYVTWCKESGRQSISKNRLAREGVRIIGKSKTVRRGDRLVRVYGVRSKEADMRMVF